MFKKKVSEIDKVIKEAMFNSVEDKNIIIEPWFIHELGLNCVELICFSIIHHRSWTAFLSMYGINGLAYITGTSDEIIRPAVENLVNKGLIKIELIQDKGCSVYSIKSMVLYHEGQVYYSKC